MHCARVRKFHWLTWLVIGLLMLMIVSLVLASTLALDLSFLIIPLAFVSRLLIPLILAYMVLSIIVVKVKAWLERYLDALVEQKTGAGETNARMAVLNEKLEHMEKQLEHIEDILVKVSE
ncbi:hypothetical protein RJ40_03515 [Methanofollis aquaemaris]|uniref:Uncharacterized protein n=1 Tax=Methanofollis aquaemaris TaxID=126734 RepID=A0A8A3S4M0_9EURY|nr:hypothetical protein [Methanofollis aquaemaris]QSZ66630.1 hypothetical protein RJ40_03515 [Methanofollis aquaemaris]